MPTSSTAIRVGLISDTHGLLRPEAIEALRGSDFIVHAGDVGDASILEQLASIAPVTAVRGNTDHGDWARALPETAVLQLGEALIYVIHDVAELDLDPAAAGVHAVVSGHSHRASREIRGGVLFINPGSAGPRRFNLPISAGELLVSDGRLRPRLFELTVAAGD
jgi:putative phosphoesterase